MSVQPSADTGPTSEQATTLPVERPWVTSLRAPGGDSVPRSHGRLDARQMCIVEVAAGGLHGAGESRIDHPARAPAERMATLSRGVAPLLIGMDASRPADVLSDLGDALLAIGRSGSSARCGAVAGAGPTRHLLRTDLLLNTGVRVDESVPEPAGPGPGIEPDREAGRLCGP